MRDVYKGKNDHAIENIEFTMALNRFSRLIKTEEFTGFEIMQVRITQSFIHELINKSKSWEFDDEIKQAFDNLAKEVSDWLETDNPNEFKEREL